MIERRVARFGVLVEQHRVALRKGATLAVLAGLPYGVAFLEQRAQGERFARRPIDSLAAFNRLGAMLKETPDCLVNGEPIRNGGDFLADLAQQAGINARITAPWIVGVACRVHSGPASVESVGLVRLVALAGLEFGVEPRAPVGLHLLDFAFGDDALADEFFAVDLQRRRMSADLLVHQWLGERRLVALVVAEAPVTEHVDDDGF